MADVELLDHSTNQAVVKLSGRQFPGSVVQGDSLSILYHLACDIEDRIANSPDDQLRDTAVELRSLLEHRLQHYDHVITSKGFDRPYSPIAWRNVA